VGLFSKSGQQQAPAAPPQPRVETHTSLALKALCQALDEERKYSILDLGPACGVNIEFLSRYSSKIRVEDLYKTLIAASFFERGEEPFDESVFGRILSIPSQERFDIILTWDLLNYFKTDEFRALAKYLSAFCTRGTFFFAICSILKEIPAVPINFKIAGSETLLYDASSTEMRPCPRYAPRDLGLLMTGFRVHNSYILRNGMQEYLFVRE